MRDFIGETNANPLPADLFLELVDIAHEAMVGKRREIPHALERDMSKPGYYLTDCPENQMGMSIVRECRQRFGKEKGRVVSHSFLQRWFAIGDIRETSRIDEFLKRKKGTTEILINDAIFKAAAECPLGPDGHFDESFVDRARRIDAADPENDIADPRG